MLALKRKHHPKYYSNVCLVQEHRLTPYLFYYPKTVRPHFQRGTPKPASKSTNRYERYLGTTWKQQQRKYVRLSNLTDLYNLKKSVIPVKSRFTSFRYTQDVFDMP